MKTIILRSQRFYLLILIGFLFSACTKDRGTISLTYNKGTAVYGDLNEVRSLPLLASPRNIYNPGKIFIGEDFILIGEENEGIHVFDNTNPSSPVNISFIQLPFTKEFFVDNDIIYAESHYDFLKIDLSNISMPTLIDRVAWAFAGNGLIKNNEGQVLLGFDFEITTEDFKLNSPEARELEDTYYLYYNYMNKLIPPSTVPSSFVGNSTRSKGTLNKITTYNNYVYVIGNEKLYSFENTPSQMMYPEEVYVSRNLETIYPENDHLFLGTQNSMVVMSLHSPNMPYKISEYIHPRSCDPVLPYGNVAYLTLRSGDFSGCSGDENSLQVIDISNVNMPHELNTITMDSPYGMNIINDYLFVGEGSNGLAIFDASDPINLILETKKTNIEAYDIMIHPSIPNRILITNQNGMEQYDIDFNTMNMSFLSRVNY